MRLLYKGGVIALPLVTNSILPSSGNAAESDRGGVIFDTSSVTSLFNT